MDIFNIFTMLGGLAMFLYGMQEMGNGLEKVSGGSLERILEKLTNNPIKGVLVGCAVTAVIQSSSATTVMVVGFVNSGIMTLKQALGIIMGANIGTTMTSWILSLSGLEGENFLIKMMKPTAFSPILAIVGIGIIMFAKSNRKKDIAGIMVNFAILMFGMSTMSDAVAGLKDMPEFANILLMFSNPVLGVLAGAALTAIIQSSSASVGILQALSATGAITFGSAIPIILGQNIGTCATAMISCIGANKNAKRAAFIHLYFNVFGTFLFLIGFYAINAVFPFPFLGGAVDGFNIAVVHTIFNLTTTAILLPFSGLLVKLAEKTVKEGKKKQGEIYLDERFLNTPTFALQQCKSMVANMASIAFETVTDAIGQIHNFDSKKADAIAEEEESIDKYEDVMGDYLVKLSSKDLSDYDSRETSKLLHCIGDYERIGDHAISILRSAREMADKKISFSDEALEELAVVESAVSEILLTTNVAFITNDKELARKVEPLEQVIDTLKLRLKKRHIKRLQDGECTIELGFIFSDILTCYERISDHCSNIAVYVIQIQEENMSTHKFLHEIKKEDNTSFMADFEEFTKKYSLPV